MKPGLLLADDLMFTSRVTGTARSLGLDVKVCRTLNDLLAKARELSPGGVLLDVHVAGLDLGAAMGTLKAQEPPPYVVAFGSHVDVDTLRRAREAGCDLVLPRSKFVQELDASLVRWLHPDSC